jgi:hypothetical protein
MTENFADSFSALFKLALQSSPDDKLPTEEEIGYLEPGPEKERRLEILRPMVAGFIEAIWSQGLHSSDLFLMLSDYYRTSLGPKEGHPEYWIPARVVGALLSAAARESEVEDMELP